MIVTSAGKNVYPDEVELIYKNLPYVREMCVIGVKSRQQREEVHGVFVGRVGRSARTRRRWRSCRRRYRNGSASIPSYQASSEDAFSG